MLGADMWAMQCVHTDNFLKGGTTQICVLCGQAAAVRLHINVPFPK